MRRRYKKIGLPPGSLMYTGESRTDAVRIDYLHYSVNSYEEFKNTSLETCLKPLPEDVTTWIHITGIHDTKVIETLGKHFKLHPLVLEDISSVGQRAKMDDYKDYLFIVMQMLNLNSQNLSLQEEQISFVLCPNLLLSFSEKTVEVFDVIKNRIYKEPSRIRQFQSDYLCYNLIDAIVDHYFYVLEKVDESLEDLEQEILGISTPKILNKVQHLKRVTLQLKKSIWPVRDVVNSLRFVNQPWIHATTHLYLHDVYDHLMQAADAIESFRELTSEMLTIHLSHLNQKLNEVMKVLTVVATLFVPLTFIASIYGMNFDYMPELHLKWGYPAILSFMGILVIGMIIYFRRQRWL